jgi:hypothetical protein
MKHKTLTLHPPRPPLSPIHVHGVDLLWFLAGFWAVAIGLIANVFASA